MNAERLREGLDRLAESAPRVDVPDDTWARGRRSLAGRRLAAMLATAACVLAVAGLSPWLLDPSVSPVADTAPPPDSSVLGVPDHIWAVPEHLESKTGIDDRWATDLLESDLAIGPAAAAFHTPAGLPVLVDAHAGGYHLLDLPDYVGNDFFLSVYASTRPLALAPDGVSLAYAYAVIGPDAATEPIPSGVRVVDLVSGEIREIPLPGREGTLVTGIAWSPDSRWLAWAGERKDSWTAESIGGTTYVAGRVPPGASTSEPIPVGEVFSDPAIAVEDAGRVTLLSQQRVATWDGHRLTRWRSSEVDVAAGSARISPDGRTAAIPTWAPDGSVAATSLLVVDIDAQQTTRTQTGLGFDDNAYLRPLGWAGGKVLVHAGPGAGGDVVVLVNPERVGHSRVVTVESGASAMLSLAVDLMRPGRLTVQRDAPDWPWSVERRAVTIAVVAVVAGVVGFVGWLLVGRVRRPLATRS